MVPLQHPRPQVTLSRAFKSCSSILSKVVLVLVLVLDLDLHHCTQPQTACQSLLHLHVTGEKDPRILQLSCFKQDWSHQRAPLVCCRPSRDSEAAGLLCLQWPLQPTGTSNIRVLLKHPHQGQEEPRRTGLPMVPLQIPSCTFTLWGPGAFAGLTKHRGPHGSTSILMELEHWWTTLREEALTWRTSPGP